MRKGRTARERLSFQESRGIRVRLTCATNAGSSPGFNSGEPTDMDVRSFLASFLGAIMLMAAGPGKAQEPADPVAIVIDFWRNSANFGWRENIPAS